MAPRAKAIVIRMVCEEYTEIIFHTFIAPVAIVGRKPRHGDMLGKDNKIKITLN